MRIYLLAGIATRESFFVVCRQRLEQLSQSAGWTPDIRVLYPYGDDRRSVLLQAPEVLRDVLAARRGGRHIAQIVGESSGGDSPLVLIGHSGGGAAACHAADLLRTASGLSDIRVVQIGSPRVPVSRALAAHVCYLYAVDASGRRTDPVTRLGSWGGWSQEGRSRMPRWQPLKHAPGHIEAIPLLGGHTDYLRHADPYIDADRVSNLERTLGRAWSWLTASLRER
ncbi:hypothetical protein IDH44_06975 [Paenibacillus sp. IB182496]|uniref:Alpha/beta hydrolase family protein n=1 Tax=Paenibacillus sabuli TaxID=2772509 RepID=A0A927BS61_9BACL|nr:hypothetical protein [Paenibacillus sabuli]MBD2844926.1 hypothetical protein [Paenibacillus sabuli]